MLRPTIERPPQRPPLRLSFPKALSFKSEPQKDQRSRSTSVQGDPAERANRVWDGFSNAIAAPLLRRQEQRNELILSRHGFEPFHLDTTVGRVHATRCTTGSGVGAAIFVHGLSSSAAGNAPILATLTGFFKDVAAFDLLCHGRNAHLDAVDLHKLRCGAYESMRAIAHMQGGNVTLLGHSMGGYLVLDAACTADAEQWISGVIAGSPPGVTTATQDERSEAVALFKMEERRHAFDVGRRACPEFSPPFRFLVAAVAWHRFRRASVQTVIRSDVSTCELRDEQLKDVRMPVLLCWGKRDGLVSVRHLEHLLSILPRHLTQAVIAPQTGHGNFVDGEPVYMEGIVRFMTGVDGVQRRLPPPKRNVLARIDSLRPRIAPSARRNAALQA